MCKSSVWILNGNVKNLFLSVLWHCWLGDRKGIRPVKHWALVCLWWWFDWNFAHLIAPVAATISIILSSNKIQNGDILVVPADPGPPGKWPLLWMSLPLPSFLASIKPANPGSPWKVAVKTEREWQMCNSCLLHVARCVCQQTGFSGNMIILSVFYYGGIMMNESQITVGELSSFLLYAAFVGVSIGGQIHSCSSRTRSSLPLCPF